MRAISQVAPQWWDYTTLDREILDEAARLTVKDLAKLSRPGFQIHFYDTPQEFYCAEALEYIEAWQQATPDNPVGVCGPIGPTEQLPLVAQMVNAMGLKLHNAHFWGMDEWVVDGKEADEHFALGFKKADLDLLFNRIQPAGNLKLPEATASQFFKQMRQTRRAAADPAGGLLQNHRPSRVRFDGFDHKKRTSAGEIHTPIIPRDLRKLRVVQEVLVAGDKCDTQRRSIIS
jgi:glucosamine-6-phosphate deaminase